MISDQRTWPIGAMAIGVPGWPEFAFSTASADNTLTVLMHNCSRSCVLAPTAPGWGRDVVLAMPFLPKKPCHLTRAGWSEMRAWRFIIHNSVITVPRGHGLGKGVIFIQALI